MKINNWKSILQVFKKPVSNEASHSDDEALHRVTTIQQAETLGALMQRVQETEEPKRKVGKSREDTMKQVEAWLDAQYLVNLKN